MLTNILLKGRTRHLWRLCVLLGAMSLTFNCADDSVDDGTDDLSNLLLLSTFAASAGSSCDSGYAAIKFRNNTSVTSYYHSFDNSNCSDSGAYFGVPVSGGSTSEYRCLYVGSSGDSFAFAYNSGGSGCTNGYFTFFSGSCYVVTENSSTWNRTYLEEQPCTQ